jgi:hypothetical protein
MGPRVLTGRVRVWPAGLPREAAVNLPRLSPRVPVTPKSSCTTQFFELNRLYFSLSSLHFIRPISHISIEKYSLFFYPCLVQSSERRGIRNILRSTVVVGNRVHMRTAGPVATTYRSRNRVRVRTCTRGLVLCFIPKPFICAVNKENISDVLRTPLATFRAVADVQQGMRSLFGDAYRKRLAAPGQ